ncbi:dihydrofolate reductase family protein [Allosphingosinicella sp.]|uniref:dihydrofolate reductase family protein n=1 Tax=Allosphingosinicella sp. TaxID=2823234 RepID=UPI002FC0C4C7
MRNLIAGAFVSLDGVMQAPGGPEEDPTGGFDLGGWTTTYWDDVMDEAAGEIYGRPFDLLLGRKTYEIFAAHWPYSDEQPIADQLNGARKYVATRGSEPLTWANSVAIHDAAKDVARLKREDGPDLMTQGSSDLLRTLFAHDLVDQLNLLIFPVVLGKGKRLFESGAAPGAFTLSESKVATTGVIIAAYRRAGEVPTGSFALDEPTEAELKRREKLQAEA